MIDTDYEQTMQNMMSIQNLNNDPAQINASKVRGVRDWLNSLLKNMYGAYILPEAPHDLSTFEVVFNFIDDEYTYTAYFRKIDKVAYILAASKDY